uniref:YchJ-like middle NTF2-like domain-containing protein n=1 Tax=Dunaliella tertiolecta TaxID=3047 RepID=A0A7S3RB51_DUNTE|mmetsp:Transcript_19493/g.54421  ORF Transcript_19493/g.54421 Transcript_19493/m.54421 type:complete len:254 (-) Transcript_19493:720-1481(-)
MQTSGLAHSSIGLKNSSKHQAPQFPSWASHKHQHHLRLPVQSPSFDHASTPPQTCLSIRQGKRLICLPTAAGFGFGLKKDKKKEQCPCGSEQPLEACCKPYLDSSNGAFLTHPPSAEACLRARFTAYKLKNPKFVTKTTSTCNPARKGSVSADGQVKTTLEQDVKVSQAWIQYEALRILAHEHDAQSNEELFDIEVDIRQLFELETGKKIKNPPLQTVRETARFGMDEEGRWVSKGTKETNWDRESLQQKGPA